MTPKNLILLSLLLATTGCTVAPRIQIAERLDFEYIPTSSQIPMSYDDMLCCVECHA